MDKITLVAVDDHPLALAGLEKILEQAPDIQMIGRGQNGDEAIKLVKTLRPQVLILDLRMPGMRAWEVALWAAQEYPEMTVLTLSGHDRDYYLSKMLDSGAAGCLDKNTRGETLIEKIREAAGGEKLFDEMQVQRAERWNREFSSKWQSLTEREREVLLLLAKGATNPEIAQQFQVEERTVVFHVCNILKKLEVKTRQQAGLWVSQYLEYTSERENTDSVTSLQS